MSSVQAFPLTFNRSNITSYYSAKTDSATLQPTSTGGTSSMIGFKSKSEQSVTINDAAKNLLFPNSTSKPTSAHITLRHTSGSILATAYAGLYFGSTRLFNASQGYGSTKTTDETFSDSAVTGANKNTTIKFSGYSSNGNYSCFVVDATLTLYFTRYDFSASAGDGVTSASVSSSTGYDGDTVTFSCVIPTGYVFDGWYNGNTLVSTSQSYVHTVNGADLTLTAKAHKNSFNVNGTYNGSTKAILTGITGNVGVSYNGKSATLNTSNPSHTLACDHKGMRGNVAVGSASLATSGKIMKTNLVLNYV